MRIRLGSKIIEFDELIQYAFACYWFANVGFVITWIDYQRIIEQVWARESC